MSTENSNNKAVLSPPAFSWEPFISAGFRTTADEAFAKVYLEKNTPTDTILEDELHIFYRFKDGIKYFTVCCACGNSRMLLHENGVRCHSCGKFHSHDNYNRMRLKVTKLARFGDGKKEIKPQPFIIQEQKRKLYVNKFRQSLQKSRKR